MLPSISSPDSAAAMGAERLDLLVIDDDPADVGLIEAFLEEGFHSPIAVTVADRLSNGFEKLSAHHFHLVLLDLSLPDSRGIDTFLRFHRRAENVPIVVLTGLDDEAVALEAVSQGAEDYILKGRLDADMLARSVRFAIERFARQRVERELRAADEIQQRLYPQQAPGLDGFDLAGAVFPAAETCGDYFDFVPLPSGAVACLVADVSGHGLGPALIMIETRAYIHALARSIDDVGEMLEQVNQLLSEMPKGLFVTMIVARFFPRQHKFQYASAGHPGFLIDAQGSARQLSRTRPALGLKTDREPRVAEVPISPDDVLLLATDGFQEAASPQGELFGTARLLDDVRDNRQQPAAHIVQALHDSARDFSGGSPQTDDMAAVVVKTL